MSRIRPAAFIAIATLAVACAKPRAWRAPSIQDNAALPTVMVSAMVEVESEMVDDHQSVGEIAATVVQNLRIDDFGAGVMKQVAPLLGSKGFAVEYDVARAKSLQKANWGDMANALTPLTGTWFEPRGSALRLADNTLFRRKIYQRIAKHLASDRKPEGYATVVVTVRPRRKYLVMKYPQIKLSTTVIGDDGRELFRARGFGAGRSMVLFWDRSEENLHRALKAAIASIETVPIEPTDE